MPGQNFLDRFRPIGAPGSAVPTGVPTSDVLGTATELAPVFAALAPDIEACTRLVEDARKHADLELSRARDQANAILAQARLDVGSEEAQAAAGVLQIASETDARLLDTAGAAADELESTGTARLASVVRIVMDAFLAEQLAP